MFEGNQSPHHISSSLGVAPQFAHLLPRASRTLGQKRTTDGERLAERFMMGRGPVRAAHGFYSARWSFPAYRGSQSWHSRSTVAPKRSYQETSFSLNSRSWATTLPMSAV